jgi:hypothetical protein
VRERNRKKRERERKRKRKERERGRKIVWVRVGGRERERERKRTEREREREKGREWDIARRNISGSRKRFNYASYENKSLFQFARKSMNHMIEINTAFSSKLGFHK